MPIRELFQAAPHVLGAVKPCWAMSPLVVSQLLPAERCFDVVIFDEASQVTPADAVGALMRADQAVVAGDPYQLPPTPFFVAGVDDGGAAVMTPGTRSTWLSCVTSSRCSTSCGRCCQRPTAPRPSTGTTGHATNG